MREMAGWTILSMVVTASRLAIWLDDVIDRAERVR